LTGDKSVGQKKGDSGQKISDGGWSVGGKGEMPGKKHAQGTRVAGELERNWHDRRGTASS